MSNTIYVNASANNSEILSENNNKYKYKLPSPLAIPTGTQITCMNSIINLQGITGASIEIKDEVRETIIFQYYLIDTTHNAPTNKLGTPESATDHRWNALQDLTIQFHGQKEFGQPIGGATLTDWDYGSGLYARSVASNETGFTETILPCMTPSQWSGTKAVPTGVNYLIPYCGEVEIVIPSGTYSISKISELITDQINGIEIPSNSNRDYIDFQLRTDNNQNQALYNGFQVNGTTMALAKFTDKFNTTAWNNWYTSGTAINDFDPNEENDHTPRPYKLGDPLTRPMMAVSMEFAKEIRDNTIQGYLGSDVPPDYLVNNIVHKDAPTGPGTPDAGIYNRFFRSMSSKDVANQNLSYNVMNNGFAIGASNFSLSYDSEKSGFKFDKLHTPRTIPTTDSFGNKMDNPGQEGYFIKRQCGANTIGRQDERPPTREPEDPLNRAWSQCLSQPMTRTTGIMIFNWAYQTAKREGTNPTLPGSVYNPNRLTKAGGTQEGLDDLDKFKNFEEFFESKASAKEAWEKTIWYRLGFTYDDIQNPDNFETQFYPDKADITNDTIKKTTALGFTTNQTIDTSAITKVSTSYNGQSFSTSSTDAQKGAITEMPKDVSGLQCFNTADINTPFDIFNNSTANQATLGNAVVAYKGGFYTGAVMRPVISTSEPITASRLPVLSTNGFLLITSDLVEHTDIVKDGTYVGILDMIPKSSLSNQDYVSDRNVLTHTITNPKVISDIVVNIVNADLTDVELEPNSNILLSITFPMPKQTELLANSQISAVENSVVNTAQKDKADTIGVSPELASFMPYTIPLQDDLAIQEELQAQAFEEDAYYAGLAFPDLPEAELDELRGGGGFAPREFDVVSARDRTPLAEQVIEEVPDPEPDPAEPQPAPEPERPPERERPRRRIVRVRRPEPAGDVEPASAPDMRHPLERESSGRIVNHQRNKLQKQINLLELRRSELREQAGLEPATSIRGLQFVRGAKPREIKAKQERIDRMTAEITELKRQLATYKTPTGQAFKAKTGKKHPSIQEIQRGIEREARVGDVRARLAEEHRISIRAEGRKAGLPKTPPSSPRTPRRGDRQTTGQQRGLVQSEFGPISVRERRRTRSPRTPAEQRAEATRLEGGQKPPEKK